MRMSAAPVLVLVLAFPIQAGGQSTPSPISGPRPTALLAAGATGPLQQPFSLDSLRRDIRPTHWKEGALVGGAAAGIAFAIVANGICRGNVGGDCFGFAIGGFVVGGFMGGFVGMLIGGQFPKDEWP